MPRIEQKGIFIPVDNDGYLVNVCSHERIQSSWLKPVDEARDAYLEWLGAGIHSIYLRGSVARGTAVEGVSDLDMVAVVNRTLDSVDLARIESCSAAIESRYPFAVRVELAVFEHTEIIGINSVPAIQFMLKVFGVCLYGEDLTTSISNFSPADVVNLHSAHLGENINEVRLALSANTQSTVIRDLCRWIMKNIIRASFELVMDLDKTYSRDLYPCYHVFSNYYPDQENFMRRILELAINPSSDAEIVISVLDECRSWLLPEIEQKFHYEDIGNTGL